MSAMALVLLAVKASIFLTVLALGLHAAPSDAAYLFRRPARLARAMTAMYVVVPLYAVVVIRGFDLPHVLAAALLALAVSPVPPILPGSELRAGGRAGYTIGLLVAAAVIALVLVPLLGAVARPEVRLAPGALARVVLATIVAPLALGMAIRRLAPALAGRAAPVVAAIATVLLLAGSVPALFGAWRLITSLVGDGSVLAFLGLTLVGLAGGHLLGGPDPDDRMVLALSSAKRHPGMAITIASAAETDRQLVLAAVLLYVLVAAVASAPYTTWRKRRHAAEGASSAPSPVPR